MQYTKSKKFGYKARYGCRFCKATNRDIHWAETEYGWQLFNKKQEKSMSAWRKEKGPDIFSECCNAFPAFENKNMCCECGELATFYDLTDTISRPEGMSTEEYIEYAKCEREGRVYNNDSKFDIDLKYAQIFEELFVNIMEGKELVEIKTERDIWKNTGNIAIEWESRGKLSGIAATKADWWVHFLAEGEKL